MPINLVGSTGIDAPGFTESGVPVVESGSNSDGQWTRWSDGTQQFHYLDGQSSSGQVASGDLWLTNAIGRDHPVAFIEPPVLFGSFYRTGGTSGHVAVVTSSPTTTGWTFRGMTTVSTASGILAVTGIGRWK